MRQEALPSTRDPIRPTLSQDIDELLRGAQEYQLEALAPATIAAYRNNWLEFCTFCEQHRLPSLPTDKDVVARYLKWCADYRHIELERRRIVREQQCDELQGAKLPLPTDMLTKNGKRRQTKPVRPLKVSTIQQRLATIATIHRLNDLPTPTHARSVEDTMAGIVIAHEERGRRPKRPTTRQELRLIVGRLGGSRVDIRDRALLLLGFLGAMRRSELVAMDFANTALDREGLVYTSRRSKTNRLGCKGLQRKGIRFSADPAICPVRAFQAWVATAGISEGRIFRNLVHGKVGAELSDRAVHKILYGRVVEGLSEWLDIHARDDEQLGQRLKRKERWVVSRFTPEVIDELFERFDIPAMLDPRLVGAHSLRSGFVTTAREQGVHDHAIRDQTWHASDRMLDQYTHPQSIWKNNPTGDLL